MGLSAGVLKVYQPREDFLSFHLLFYHVFLFILYFASIGSLLRKE